MAYMNYHPAPAVTAMTSLAGSVFFFFPRSLGSRRAERRRSSSLP